jgi:SnoaL-like domain
MPSSATGSKSSVQPAGMDARLRALESHRDICNLQGRYNHYLQTGQLKDRLPDLFAFDHPDLRAEMADSGVWEGAEGVRTLFRHMATKYSMPGALMVHMLLTPVVEVDADDQGARGMWNSLGTNTYLDADGVLRAMWQVGKYDLRFVRVGKRWKYLDFRWHVIFRTPFHEGWVRQPIVEGLHEAGFPPVTDRHRPYSPDQPLNVFPPAPPEPMEDEG